MHRQFRKLLDEATASLEFAVVVNVDIRGFSSFSTKVESPNATMFIKRIYMKLVDDYFSHASFFKPTGDGLLIIIPYKDAQLQDVAVSTVTQCLKVVRDFPSMCRGDPMIYFEVPDKVGIGISREVVCCLHTGNKILDYSGRCLNLASRLMDLARPSGVVFDETFPAQLLPKELRKQFTREPLYIQGIHEREPIDVLYTKEYTTIPDRNRSPFGETKWSTLTNTWTLKRIRELRPFFRIDLPSRPVDPKQIQVEVICPKVVSGKKLRRIERHLFFRDFAYRDEAGAPYISVDMRALATLLSSKSVKAPWRVRVEVRHPEQ